MKKQHDIEIANLSMTDKFQTATLPTISLTKLYELLSVKMGSDAAHDICGYIEQTIAAELNNKANMLATKKDLDYIVGNAVTVLRDELREEIANAKKDMIKWLLILWLIQMAAIIGLYFKN